MHIPIQRANKQVSLSLEISPVLTISFNYITTMALLYEVV